MGLRRERREDAPSWPGRRLAAAMDALLWPFMAVLAARSWSWRFGVVGWVLTASLLGWALFRLRRAVFRNERYRFLSWFLLRALPPLLLLAMLLRCVAVGFA